MEQQPAENPQDNSSKSAKPSQQIILNAENERKKTIEDAPAPGDECAP